MFDEKSYYDIISLQSKQEGYYISQYIKNLKKIYKESKKNKRDKLRKDGDKYLSELNNIHQEKYNIKEMYNSFKSSEKIKENKEAKDTSIR
jgi:rubrerythrin